MTNHPLLLSTPMVLAFLAGRKRVTRRIPTCANSLVDGRRVSGKTWKAYEFDIANYELKDGSFWFFSGSTQRWYKIMPVYQPGDKLWFRETWMPYLRGTDNDGFTRLIKFKADGAEIELPDELIDWFEKVQENGFKWRPNIHLPKSACRLWADCGTVTCEHLSDLTEEQAIAEGVDKSFAYEIETPDGGQSYTTYRAGFKRIWEQLHGPDSWSANPPVYAINFNPITRKP